MQGHNYQYFELVGTSKTSIEDAVQGVLAKAADAMPNMRWFQLVETRGAIKDSKVVEWQVTVKVGCRLEA